MDEQEQAEERKQKLQELNNRVVRDKNWESIFIGRVPPDLKEKFELMASEVCNDRGWFLDRLLQQYERILEFERVETLLMQHEVLLADLVQKQAGVTVQQETTTTSDDDSYKTMADGTKRRVKA